jgi:hypothetical protein
MQDFGRELATSEPVICVEFLQIAAIGYACS